MIINILLTMRVINLYITNFYDGEGGECSFTPLPPLGRAWHWNILLPGIRVTQNIIICVVVRQWCFEIPKIRKYSVFKYYSNSFLLWFKLHKQWIIFYSQFCETFWKSILLHSCQRFNVTMKPRVCNIFVTANHLWFFSSVEVHYRETFS